MPEWADWFAGELERIRRSSQRLGSDVIPVLMKGEKEQFLDWLSWGVESGAIKFPAETGSIRWPSFNLARHLPVRPTAFHTIHLFSSFFFPFLPQIPFRTRGLPCQNSPPSMTTCAPTRPFWESAFFRSIQRSTNLTIPSHRVSQGF